MEEESNESLSMCPSFNSYSSDKVSQTAFRVSQEFKHNADGDDDDDYDDFEFSLVRADPDELADEIDIQIHPVFPIFNRYLSQNNTRDGETKPSNDGDAIKITLKNLFIREDEVGGDDEPPPSASSSEADELESVPPGTYCVWRPKAVESSPSGCKKSHSTGSSSKRWRIQDLLRRCNSDGKEDSMVFLTPKIREEKIEKNREEKVEKSEDLKEKRSSGEHVKVAGKGKSAHEVFYVRNRTLMEGGKRKSYLPYRRDLVGFFANANGLGRTFPPF